MAGMVVGNFVAADLDLSGAVGFLNLSTKAGQLYAMKRFTMPVDTKIDIEAMQKPIVAIRKKFREDKKLETEVLAALTKLAATELAVSEITHVKEIDKRITETVEQVYWKPGAFGSFLNGWGHVIEMILLWKTLLSPGFALLTPLIVVVLPFFLLRSVFGISIPISEYISLLQKMMLSSVPKIPLGEDSSPLSHVAKYAYVLMSAGVFLSNIWNQIQAALHLRAVAEDLRTRGEQLLQYVKSARQLSKLLESSEGAACADEIRFDEETMSMGAYGMMYNESRGLARLREWVGEIDLQVATARLQGICFPRARVGDKFSLSIKSLYHPGVAVGNRVLNDVTFDDKNHMLLTGPNRGGKSTLCKSVGLAIMTAQSLGFVWAKSMDFVPLTHFETALAPADTLGRLSLFEAEIEFAKHILATADSAAADSKHRPAFIIMDEIFHSTNAHDGAEASMIFLKQLYEKSRGFSGSLISTHYRELPDKLKAAAPHCMEAFDKATGLTYTYRCVPGVSTLSSVREILRERGLLE
jgi:hypothetical protein